jgi:glycine oxidase
VNGIRNVKRQTPSCGSVGIVGAGIAGLVTGFMLHRAGWQVTLFEQGEGAAPAGASPIAAGMLAPWAELSSAEPAIAALGIESLALWPEIAAATDDPGALSLTGSLIVAHPRDRAELDRLQRRIGRAARGDGVVPLDAAGLARLEPGLGGRFRDALSLPGEGHIDPQRILPALQRLLGSQGVRFFGSRAAEPHADGSIAADGQTHRFDLAVDCRGLGARADSPALRGVRGEVLLLKSDEVRLTRPVRVVHPRWPVYVVPRGDGRFVVGASEIESDDLGAVRVRSALELLSAAYALDPAFGEATIEGMRVGLRPAYPDNLPRIETKGCLIRLNGLFRHGYLMAPALASRICAQVNAGFGENSRILEDTA